MKHPVAKKPTANARRHAMQSGVYDTRSNTLSKELAALADTTPEFFAPLRNGHETHPLSGPAAQALGLPEGIPVAGPYMDHEAGFLSVSGTSGHPLQCSLGTAWVGNFCLPEGITGTSPFQFAIPAPHAEGQLVIQPLLTGNVTWDWALHTFVDNDPDRALEKQATLFAERILPAPGLVAVPWLNRPNCLAPEALGSATIHGVSPSTDHAELLRAVAAGMCLELARVFAAVTEAGIIDSLVLSGGASQGPQFRQLLAALFEGVPVHRVEEERWMGTRGVLYAFDRACAQARLCPVERDGDKALDVQGARAIYQEVWKRVCGHVAAGQAYTITKGGS
jgi:sugar (pentulose or hexulose) kinase